VFSSETPMTELDRAQDLLAEFNVKKTLKNTAATFNDLFSSNENQDDQDSWDDLDADDLLKDIL